MGVLYSVIPLGTLGTNDIADVKKNFREYGLEFPDDADQGRHATQREIETVLRSFELHEYEFRLDSVAGTDAPWKQASLFRRAPPDSQYTFEQSADLVALEPPPDKDSPCNFYFSKGSIHLNYAILERLARACGPLLCITECEYDAVVFHRKAPPSFATDHHLRDDDGGPR